MRSVTTSELGDGIVCHTSPGPEPTIMWIHGYTMDATIWTALWNRMPRWRHVGIDLPGHGASRGLRAGETLPELGEQLGAAAVAAGVQHVVALSFGTIIALQMAVAHPAAFQSVVLASPAFGGGPLDRGIEARYEDMGRLYNDQADNSELIDAWLSSSSGIFAGAAGKPELWAQLRSIIDRHAWTEFSDGSLFALARFPQAAQDLRPIQARILLLVGENDMEATFRSSSILSTRLDNAAQAEVASAGHLALLEQPEAAVELLEAHLSNGCRNDRL